MMVTRKRIADDATSKGKATATTGGKASLPFLAAGSCHENWYFATRSSRRLMCCANCLHLFHLSPSPSSIRQKRRTTLLPTRTRSLGVRHSWKISRLPGSTLFIDGEPDHFLFKFSTTPKESVRFPNFTTCRVSQVSTVSVTRSNSLWYQDLDH